MLRIAGDVKSFLKGNALCEGGCHDDTEEKDADLLVLCTYFEKPHTIALCKECAVKLDSICECGSGACASGQISSVLYLNGTELSYANFNKARKDSQSITRKRKNK